MIIINVLPVDVWWWCVWARSFASCFHTTDMRYECYASMHCCLTNGSSNAYLGLYVYCMCKQVGFCDFFPTVFTSMFICLSMYVLGYDRDSQRCAAAEAHCNYLIDTVFAEVILWWLFPHSQTCSLYLTSLASLLCYFLCSCTGVALYGGVISTGK